MKAYSMDLRARVSAACDEGMGTAEAAETFSVARRGFGGSSKGGVRPA